jgi:hypothetical protein
MAKNKPVQKTTPPVRPSAAQAKQPQATVRSASKSKSTGGWLRLPSSQNKELLFDKFNYILLGVGALLIVLGFILMSGGNKDPKVFNEAEIYSFRRITLAPITVISGFLVIIAAILKKPSANQEV